MSSSTISEIVLRCKPDTRARSAREMGWRVRIRFRTMRRLMSRTTSLEAACGRFASMSGILFNAHTNCWTLGYQDQTSATIHYLPDANASGNRLPDIVNPDGLGSTTRRAAATSLFTNRPNPETPESERNVPEPARATLPRLETPTPFCSRITGWGASAAACRAEKSSRSSPEKSSHERAFEK